LIVVKKISEEAENIIKHFLSASVYGQCYCFAIALHRNLGWPIVGILKGENIIHAGVKSPEGKIWDGRGEVLEKEFFEPFKLLKKYPIINVKEERLIYTGKVSEELVELYKEKAQAVWPDLPWKNQTYQQKVVAFTEELEALSRKYKLWITGPYPAKKSVILEGFDDEVGYEIELTGGDGTTHTIDRKLKY